MAPSLASSQAPSATPSEAGGEAEGSAEQPKAGPSTASSSASGGAQKAAEDSLNEDTQKFLAFAETHRTVLNQVKFPFSSMPPLTGPMFVQPLPPSTPHASNVS